VIDEYSPHHLCGDAEELRPIAPFDSSLVNETKICLIDQRRGLKRVGHVLASHRACGLPM
jgi:hypothetical protein